MGRALVLAVSVLITGVVLADGRQESPEHIPNVSHCTLPFQQTVMDQAGICGVNTIDPCVAMDPMYQNYPDMQAVATRNALHVAELIKQDYILDGFKVYKSDAKSTYVGPFPSFFMGFPKSGTTTAWRAMLKAMPCMVSTNKEPHFWMRDLNLDCVSDEGLLSCEGSKGRIMQQFEAYVRRGRQMRKRGCNTEPFVVDGSMHSMFQWHTSDYPVEMDMAVLIHALAPNARFITLVRGNTVEHLRSQHFFFQKQSTARQYEISLTRAEEVLRVQAATENKCYQFVMGDTPPGVKHNLAFKSPRTKTTVRYSADFLRYRVRSFGCSCNIFRFVKLFPGKVFMTDLGSLLQCQDGFKEWMGPLWGGAECFPQMSKSMQSKLPELNVTVRQLESGVLRALDEWHYPLIPMGSNRQYCHAPAIASGESQGG